MKVYEGLSFTSWRRIIGHNPVSQLEPPIHGAVTLSRQTSFHILQNPHAVSKGDVESRAG